MVSHLGTRGYRSTTVRWGQLSVTRPVTFNQQKS